MSFLRSAWRGESDRALACVTERLETAARWDDLYSLFMADGYALVSDLDRALFWLDHAIDHGIANAPFLSEHDPFLAPLRSDERFAGLMDKAGRVSESITS